MIDTMNVNYETSIPNNVGLSEDRRILKALERWHPGYLDWWNDMGPDGFQESLLVAALIAVQKPPRHIGFCKIRVEGEGALQRRCGADHHVLEG